MKPSQNPVPGERRGLFCPKCNAPLGTKYVAKSYASAAGHYRTRHCGCGVEVETSEVVIGNTLEVIDVTGLSPDQLRLIRSMLAQFRRENVVIDMPHARVPAQPLALPAHRP